MFSEGHEFRASRFSGTMWAGSAWSPQPRMLPKSNPDIVKSQKSKAATQKNKVESGCQVRRNNLTRTRDLARD